MRDFPSVLYLSKSLRSQPEIPSQKSQPQKAPVWWGAKLTARGVADLQRSSTPFSRGSSPPWARGSRATIVQVIRLKSFLLTT